MMGYINVETENFSSRVILGKHSETTPAASLDTNVTGVVLEGSYIEPKTFFDRLIDKANPDIQYKEVLELAKTSGMPIVAGEPAWKKSLYQEFRQHQLSTKESLLLVLFSLMSAHATNFLVKYAQEIEAGDSRVRWTNLCADLTVKTIPYMRINGPFKNLLMAQRVAALGDLQKSHGIKRPCIDIIVGVNHAKIVNALQMPEEDRLNSIAVNIANNIYVSSGSLRTINYMTYNSSRHKWVRNTFTDKRMKNF